MFNCIYNPSKKKPVSDRILPQSINILLFFLSLFIVGAGLSAADAIIAALNKGLSVVHVFRRSANDRRLIFNNLPAAIYPEYHEIHRMMAKKQSRRGYQPYGQHHVVKIGKNNMP